MLTETATRTLIAEDSTVLLADTRELAAYVSAEPPSRTSFARNRNGLLTDMRRLAEIGCRPTPERTRLLASISNALLTDCLTLACTSPSRDVDTTCGHLCDLMAQAATEAGDHIGTGDRVTNAAALDGHLLDAIDIVTNDRTDDDVHPTLTALLAHITVERHLARIDALAAAPTPRRVEVAFAHGGYEEARGNVHLMHPDH